MVCSFILEYAHNTEGARPHARISALAKATILHTEIEGSSHPYTKKYRDDFIKLTKEVSPQPDDDRLTLSDEDTAAFLKHF